MRRSTNAIAASALDLPGASFTSRERRGPARQRTPPTPGWTCPFVYKSNTITDYKELPARSHYTCAEESWEEVADLALEWAVARATGAEMTAVAPA